MARIKAGLMPSSRRADHCRRLNEMLQKDNFGYFSRTWETLQFSFFVLDNLEESSNTVVGFNIHKLKATRQVVGMGICGPIVSATTEFHGALFADRVVKFLPITIEGELFARSDISSTDSLQDPSESDEAALHYKELSLLSMLTRFQHRHFFVEINGIVIGSDGRLGLVMPYYQQNLEALVSDLDFPLSAVKVFRRCVECVMHLHNLGKFGVVHNDIKAKNFLIKDVSDENSIVLTDFGFSLERQRITQHHISGGYSSIGGVGKEVGTLAYASPEVKEVLREGGKLVYTKRSDIYSLGVLLGSLITRKKPYQQCKTEFHIYNSHDGPFSLSHVSEDHFLVNVFVWCSAHSPDSRPKSCEDILKVLDKQQIE